MPVMLSVLLAVAPLAAPAAHEPRERHAVCAVVAVGSDRDPHQRDRFSATRILDIEFEVRLSGERKRERTLQLRLQTPRGFLYQVLEMPIDTAGRKKHRYEARLKVAGTSIMASGLYGRWTVVPHLDDAREPCGPSRHFVIEP